MISTMTWNADIFEPCKSGSELYAPELSDLYHQGLTSLLKGTSVFLDGIQLYFRVH